MSALDHSRAPVLEALEQFHRRGDWVFAPPGHRQGYGVDPRVLAVMGHGAFASDVLMMNGIDDRRVSQGILEQAQELMADAVGAEHAFFSTCGSSLSVKSAMLAVAGPGEKLLISRNAHKSVISGVIVNGTVPIWVHPKWDPGRHLAHPPEADDVRRALEANPDAKGMLLITPTDWGTCADIQAVAEVCHAYGVPLIVDEAWGAHLPFHDQLPTWGMDAGADVVVTSVHKMGAAVEQSSVFHLQGDRVDPTVLKQREDLLGTTSASNLVYASLDGWRRHMVEQGSDLLGRTLELARDLHDEIDGIEGIAVMGEEVVEEGYAAEIDPFVISMDVRDLGITGYQAAELVRTRSHVDLASADAVRVNARLTHGDDDIAGERLLAALRDLARVAPSVERSGEVRLPEPGELELETVMRPRDAFFAQTEQVPVADAVGRVAAEMVTPYPPGVPAIAPGERITQAVVDYLRSGVEAGMLIPEAADAEVTSLRVVRGR